MDRARKIWNSIYRHLLSNAMVLIVVTTALPGQQKMTNGASGAHRLTASQASHFAELALSCVHKHYPNKLSQVLKDSTQLKPPKELHPAFYGCFDWHSSVHGHWMLVKLLKLFPDLPERGRIENKLSQSLMAEHIAGEIYYFRNASPSWERTYGWAWLLQLAAELHSWDTPTGQRLAVVIQPLADEIRNRYIEFMPKQDYPIRTGVHPNTAFGISFALDYARLMDDRELIDVLEGAALKYYSEDEGCPIDWEPGGEDFLSPCLEEAALMSRVLDVERFNEWFPKFMEDHYVDFSLLPANVSDRSDPKIVHLDGLNLSRAWDLLIISKKITNDEVSDRMYKAALQHLDASLPYVVDQYYEGSHWLGSFAVYALSMIE